MNVGEKIKQLRTLHSISQTDLANTIKVSKQTLYKYEKGIVTNIPSDKIELIASYFNVSPAYIMGWEDEHEALDLYSIENIEPMPKLVQVPLLGTIACGEPLLAEENIEDILSVPEKYKGTFALRCKGDSMITARILDGDIVFIREQSTVENGEIAAVLIGDEATLKRVYLSPDRIEFRAENPSFKPLCYYKEELNNIRILGKAVGFLSRVI